MGRPCSVAKVTAARSAVEPLQSLDKEEEFEPIRHSEFFKHMKQVVLDRMLAEFELIALCLLLLLSKP
jgi:membrane carboxypeptidase/penicillin-binding protein